MPSTNCGKSVAGEKSWLAETGGAALQPDGGTSTCARTMDEARKIVGAQPRLGSDPGRRLRIDHILDALQRVAHQVHPGRQPRNQAGVACIPRIACWRACVSSVLPSPLAL
jgi:hypothetical protein